MLVTKISMTKSYESQTNESDGCTKLLSSRPELDNYVGKTLVRNSFLATAPQWRRGRIPLLF